ncbi:MAG: hypothetical protein C4519_00050 [Desulfobacteraceae bacterium]|nr:MAG: hypothetical protein C4519_00050 [Desulfobacteraceae bacterium]
MNKLGLVIGMLIAVIGLTGVSWAAELKTDGWLGTKTAYSQRTSLGQLYPREDVQGSKYTHMRGRLLFNFITAPGVGLVWHNEIDFDFGSGAYGQNNGNPAAPGGVNRGFGGGLGADTVNLETKQLYMYFKVPEIPLKANIGVNWITDDFDWVILGDDAAGFTVNYGESFDIRLGAYRFWEENITSINDNVDFYMLSGSKKIGKSKIGLAGYYLWDRGSNGDGVLNTSGPSGKNGFASLAQNAATGFRSLIPTGTDYELKSYFAGIFGETMLPGAINLSAWGVYNFGEVDVQGGSDIDINGFAVNARLSKKINNVNLTMNGIYISGADKDDDQEFGFTNAGLYSLAGNFYYKSGMMILMPDGDDWNYSSALVYGISNIFEDRFLGVTGAFLNADFPIAGKLTGKVGVGTIFSAEERVVNSEKYMGSEINAKLYYQLAPKMTVALKGGYAFIGDFYKVSAAQAAASIKGVAANNPDDVLYTYLEFKVSL